MLRCHIFFYYYSQLLVSKFDNKLISGLIYSNINVITTYKIISVAEQQLTMIYVSKTETAQYASLRPLI